MTETISPEQRIRDEYSHKALSKLWEHEERSVVYSFADTDPMGDYPCSVFTIRLTEENDAVLSCGKIATALDCSHHVIVFFFPVMMIGAFIHFNP